MTDEKSVKKQASDETHLRAAVKTMSRIVSSMARELSLQSKSESGAADVKQLKELTIAAKELSSLIRVLNNDVPEPSDEIRVSFEGETENWAK